MQKIKNSILHKMMRSNLTSKEVNFLLYISRFQDDEGLISGVHYKEVCSSMGISYQGFYDVKNSLIKKGIISCMKNNRIDHDITIIDNNNFDEEVINKGYLNTNQKVFYREDFYKLKAGAKLLAMDLLNMARAGRGKAKIGTKKFYEKYQALFGVTKRVVRSYLTALKPFLSICIVDGIYHIIPKSHICEKPKAASENDNFYRYNANVICRRNRIKSFSQKEVNDVAILMGQYKPYLDIKKDIVKYVALAVERSLETISKTPKKLLRKLRPKVVHIELKNIVFDN